jgi:hypothetical protein
MRGGGVMNSERNRFSEQGNGIQFPAESSPLFPGWKESSLFKCPRPHTLHALSLLLLSSEPVFLNIYGAQESIPRNKFRQPM